jgi:hypothetical protein
MARYIQPTILAATQMFPTYQVYTNGFAKYTIHEGDLMTFIGLNANSQYSGPR